MRYATVCSGIECLSAAWVPMGWEPVWFSEIDPFASAVLAHHYPNVPNLGDMTMIHNNPTFNEQPIGLLAGGTPCQSFSIAGLRKGLADPRGNLALVFLALLDRTRPRWVVWENVPGALSSIAHDAPDPSEPPPPLDMGCDGAEVETSDEYDADESHAFSCFLAGLSELGYQYAYRVLDAQYFGVPQRRRRVFVVGHLGTDWRPPAAVLFEPESLRRHPAESGEERQDIAATLAASFGRLHGCSGQDADHGHSHLTVMATGQSNAEIVNDGSPSLTCDHEASIVFDTAQITSKANYSNPKQGDPCHPLASTAHPPAVAFTIHGTDGTTSVASYTDTASSLRARIPSQLENSTTTAVQQNAKIRRFTPVECERLMGLPDNYTLVPYRGRMGTDGPRYKACGNGIVVPVLEWLGRRIEAVDNIFHP